MGNAALAKEYGGINATPIERIIWGQENQI